MRTMPAAVFLGEGQLALKERPVPEIRQPDDVLVRVTACGICGSDLHILHVPPGQDATPGVILGHEFYGEIIACGDAVTGYTVGDHVTVDPNLKCGTCDVCKRGMVNMCALGGTASYGQFIDGAFARTLLSRPGRL